MVLGPSGITQEAHPHESVRSALSSGFTFTPHFKMRSPESLSWETQCFRSLSLAVGVLVEADLREGLSVSSLCG